MMLIRMMLARNPLALGFLAVAAACAIVFFATLHPITGRIGGIWYLLTSWALPSVFVGSLGLAWLIPTTSVPRIAVAVPLSFVLGLNTSLPLLADALRYRQNVSSEIKRAVSWSAGLRHTIDVKRQPWGPLVVVPFGPRVRIGGDEGCMCIYFRNAELYSDRVIAALSAENGGHYNLVDYPALRDPTLEQRDVHIDLSLSRLNDGLQAVVDLFDRGEKIATFTHTGIPARTLAVRTGLGHDTSANFFENALDIFLHANLWNSMLNAITASYFPERELKAFFRQASGKS